MNRYNVVKNCQVHNLNDIYMDTFGYKTNGSFVEVGAFDGVAWSNTSCLAEVGWKGLMFEPMPEYFKKCAARYQHNDDVKVIKCCIGDYNGETKVFRGSSLSTTSEEMVDIYNTLSWSKGLRLNKNNFVLSKIFTLNYMLEKHNWEENFDVLVVDTEGTELQVLNGFDLARWCPKLAIVEAHEKHKDKVMSRNSEKINEYFGDHQYEKIYCDSVNSIFKNPR